MRQITTIEECNENEIRFLRTGDIEFQIEGDRNVDRLLDEMKSLDCLYNEEIDYLSVHGLEEYHNEFDFANDLRFLDETHPDILEKFSQRIN